MEEITIKWVNESSLKVSEPQLFKFVHGIIIVIKDGGSLGSAVLNEGL